MPLGIVVGRRGEARIARRIGEIAIGGGQSEAAAERLVAGGATALLSLGLAEALDPNLGVGDVVVPVAVLDGGRRCFTDEDLCRALGGATVGLLLAGVASEAGRSGASAADPDSGGVARVALRHRLPFAVVRAVAIPARRDWLRAIFGGLDAARARHALRRPVRTLLQHLYGADS
jgi:adenosylhomocysteine nucleosidase